MKKQKGNRADRIWAVVDDIAGLVIAIAVLYVVAMVATTAYAAPVTAVVADEYSGGIDFTPILVIVGVVGAGILAIAVLIKSVMWADAQMSAGARQIADKRRSKRPKIVS